MRGFLQRAPDHARTHACDRNAPRALGASRRRRKLAKPLFDQRQACLARFISRQMARHRLVEFSILKQGGDFVRDVRAQQWRRCRHLTQ